MLKSERVNFINEIGPIVRSVALSRGLNSISIFTCIAQACVESGYGTSKLMRNANALFGIKAGSTWVNKSKYGGLVYSSLTSECYNGKMVKITDSFRAYACLEDCISDYFDLIESDRYKKSIYQRSVYECIESIKKSGYATDPLYISKVFNCYKLNEESINKYAADALPEHEDMFIGYYIVIPYQVNFRKYAGACEGTIITPLDQNTEVYSNGDYVSINNRIWLKVEWQGLHGYIRKDFLKKLVNK